MSRNNVSNEASESDNSMDRRSVLQKIGVAGVASTGIVGEAKAGETDKVEIEREVHEVDGEARKDIIQKALSNSEVRQLISYVKQNESGRYSPNKSDTIVHRIEKANKDSDLDFSEYYLAVVPLKETTRPAESNEPSAVLWTSRSLESVGYTTPVLMEVSESEGLSGLNSSSTSNSTVAKRYTVEKGEIKENRVDNDVKSSSIQSDSTDDCYCQVDSVECEDIPWYCWVSIAASFAGTYWSCGACGIGYLIACGKCLVVVAGGSAGTYGCLKNHDCWETTRCATWEQVDSNPCVCNDVYHPNCGH